MEEKADEEKQDDKKTRLVEDQKKESVPKGDIYIFNDEPNILSGLNKKNKTSVEAVTSCK